MIISCPNCSSKYSIHANVIGEGKMVRCTICGTTWQQGSIYKQEKREDLVKNLQITTFWFIVFICIFSLIFAKNAVINFWPASASFYEAIGVKDSETSSAFSIKDISSFFIRKDDKLYMGIKGELTNITNDVQMVPGLTISLRSDDNVTPSFNSSWNHELTCKKLLPNQKIIFETDLKSIPYTDIICEIKLNTL
ncbi:MAG: hypothetical protein E7015_01595 [Alphaproteobacteria bacterium]|nr:hypothetical protein [Alphaproteobacteria bacterium]